MVFIIAAIIHLKGYIISGVGKVCFFVLSFARLWVSGAQKFWICVLKLWKNESHG